MVILFLGVDGSAETCGDSRNRRDFVLVVRRPSDAGYAGGATAG
jgi:hypothetical protein